MMIRQADKPYVLHNVDRDYAGFRLECPETRTLNPIL